MRQLQNLADLDTRQQLQHCMVCDLYRVLQRACTSITQATSLACTNLASVAAATLTYGADEEGDLTGQRADFQPSEQALVTRKCFITHLCCDLLPTG